MSTAGVSATTVSLDQFVRNVQGSPYLASDLDIGFLVATEQVKTQDAQIRRMLGEMRMASAAREIIGKRIEELRTALSEYKNDKATKDDMKKALPISTLKLDNLEQLGVELDYASQAVSQTSVGQLESTPVTSPHKRIEVRTEPGGWAMNATGSIVLQPDRQVVRQVEQKEPGITGNTLDLEIKRLESLAQQLDSQREVSMIQLNSLISKRENMVQWLSNMEKKTNDTQAGIIGNLR